MEAEAELRIALSSPLITTCNRVVVNILLGRILVDREDFEKAHPLVKEALAIKKILPEARLLLGKICVHDGQFEAARHHFEAGLTCPRITNRELIELTYELLDSRTS